MNSPRRPMTAANGYSLLELADCARATQRRIIAISNASESCLVMALTFAARQTVKMISGFAPDAIIMTAHGINHIEKALLIAQRFGKLSASIAAYRTAVRLRPLVAVGTRIAPRPPHRSRRALLTHRAPPSGRTSAARTVWNRMRSGAQPPVGSTWPLGSVSEPRPPVGCSPRVRPFPPRPPPEVAFLCSVLPRYYDLIRLLTRVHAWRMAIAFPSRPGTSAGHG